MDDGHPLGPSPAVPPPPSAPPTASARPAVPVGLRATAATAVAVTLVGLLLLARATDWRLLLWAELVLVPVGAWAVVAAARGRGGPVVAAGLLAVATRAETWLASLQGTIEGDVVLGGGDLLAWPTVGSNGAESLVVVGGTIAVVAGVRLVAARARA